MEEYRRSSKDKLSYLSHGEGYYQERGKDVIVLKKGDVIKSAKNVDTILTLFDILE